MYLCGRDIELHTLELKERKFFYDLCERGLVLSDRQWAKMYSLISRIKNIIHANVCGYINEAGDVYNMLNHTITRNDGRIVYPREYVPVLSHDVPKEARLNELAQIKLKIDMLQNKYNRIKECIE
ncbi:MAG: hypothetical protein Pg6A_19770 [Termitinemataceae bacterium]|nr:MAG: hypothetical protein Pg6A_19770 [Termitinemataceae bacterium]